MKVLDVISEALYDVIIQMGVDKHCDTNTNKHKRVMRKREHEIEISSSMCADIYR
jgi:hypothetical protein